MVCFAFRKSLKLHSKHNKQYYFDMQFIILILTGYIKIKKHFPFSFKCNYSFFKYKIKKLGDMRTQYFTFIELPDQIKVPIKHETKQTGPKM